MIKFWTVNKYEGIFVISAEFTPVQNCTALSSSNSGTTPCFRLFYDLFDTNAPITEIVYTEVYHLICLCWQFFFFLDTKLHVHTKLGKSDLLFILWEITLLSDMNLLNKKSKLKGDWAISTSESCPMFSLQNGYHYTIRRVGICSDCMFYFQLQLINKNVWIFLSFPIYWSWL